MLGNMMSDNVCTVLSRCFGRCADEQDYQDGFEDGADFGGGDDGGGGE